MTNLPPLYNPERSGTPRRRRVVPGGVLLVALIAVGWLATTHSHPSPPARSYITLTVNGSGPADTITVNEGGDIHQANDTTMPWTARDPMVDAVVGVTAQSSDGSPGAWISCRIAYNHQVVTNRSTGPYAVVTCTPPG